MARKKQDPEKTKQLSSLKTEQLGMSHGAANNMLRKAILFNMATRLDECFCFQCGAAIETEKEFSIEHKKPWLHEENAVELYFDLDNIGFSHLTCNTRAARKKPRQHGNASTYKRGCRCEPCTKAQAVFIARQRACRKELNS